MSNNNNNRSSSSSAATNYGALSGRTARACESCLKRRARWFCPADDAFLCHPCDSSVHSANELAGRHTRVRLDSSSSPSAHHHNSNSNSTSLLLPNENGIHPAWHRRKPRTPRRHSLSSNSSQQQNKKNQNDCRPPSTTLVVPQMEQQHQHQQQQTSTHVDDDVDDTISSYYSIIHQEEVDHELGFSVPVLDNPFESSHELVAGVGGVLTIDHEFDQAEFDFDSIVHFQGGDEDHNHNHQHQHVPAGSGQLIVHNSGSSSWDIGFDLGKGVVVDDEVDFADFETVDLEKLLVKTEADEEANYGGTGKVEEEEVIHWDLEIFGSGTTVIKEEEEEEVEKKASAASGWLLGDDGNNNNKRRKILMLQLNYDEVIKAWATQGSPDWTSDLGCSRSTDPTTMDTWSSSAHMWQGGGGHGGHHPHQQGSSSSGRHQNDGDGGRGARVMRYREKRKNRLFAKKIRYQVRKLNAEKRPRLKGRFVKRTTTSSSSSFLSPSSDFPPPSSFPTAGGGGIGHGIQVGPTTTTTHIPYQQR